MKRCLRLGILGFLWMLAATAYALPEPVVMLDKVTRDVTHELNKKRNELERYPDRLYGMVNHLVLPHVDFEEMARWVAGRNAWQKADANLQRQFVDAFKTLVVRTYASALLSYTDDQTIEFLPLRQDIANKQRIQVESVIKEPGKPPMRMDYRLIKQNEWKVYDIIIEGVSLLKGYQSQYSDEIRTKGLPPVIKKMQYQYKSLLNKKAS